MSDDLPSENVGLAEGFWPSDCCEDDNSDGSKISSCRAGDFRLDDGGLAKMVDDEPEESNFLLDTSCLVDGGLANRV